MTNEEKMGVDALGEMIDRVAMDCHGNVGGINDEHVSGYPVPTVAGSQEALVQPAKEGCRNRIDAGEVKHAR